MRFRQLFALLILAVAIPVAGLQDDATDDDVEAQTNTVAYLNLTYDKSGAAQVDLTLPAQPRSFLCILCG